VFSRFITSLFIFIGYVTQTRKYIFAVTF